MTLAVVTPSYRHDFQLFTDLHRSVLRLTDDSVKHYVVVPARDTSLFSTMSGTRCVVIPEESLYPAHYISGRALNGILHYLPRIPSHARVAAINMKRPFRPIRGWMMQQALKIEACRQLSEQVVLLVDSDVELVRPVTETTFKNGEHARLYSNPGEIDSHLPDHMKWQTVSHQLLGLPSPEFPAPGYVTSLCVWEPTVVQGMVARVEEVTGQPWMDVITRLPTFSEWTLYGVFAAEILKYSTDEMTSRSLCHSYWGPDPLTVESATDFVSRIDPDDVAVLIQSKSRTPREVRRAALGAFEFDRNSPKDVASQ